MKISFILVILTALSGLQCARIQQFNTPENIGIVKMQIAELMFHNGKKVALKNIMVNMKHGTITQDNGEVEYKYNLSELKSLRYSNHNLDSAGFIVGFTTGFFLVQKSLGRVSAGSKSEFSISGTNGLLSFIAGLVLGKVGYDFCAVFYVNWQEFDLKLYRQYESSLGLKPIQSGVGIGIKFPLNSNHLNRKVE